jgi:zinc/manganese transport system substrate-binding protein
MIAGCGASAGGAPDGRILAVGAENEYANVISQIGGRYVKVSAVQSNPNADPHAFEASPSIATEIAEARLVVQNGLGYDPYMERIESATSSSSRRVIDVQRLLGLPDSTPNPHLWYRPQTMPLVAGALARDLAAIQPAHAAYFEANAARFDASLRRWTTALREFGARYGGVKVAVTEPVGDYMLEAAGARILTPFTLQSDVMNGTDPAPQDVAVEGELLSKHRVKALLYNEQVTDSLTESLLKAASSDRIPIVAVYETMPTPGYDYQSWMLAELRALERAVIDGVSTKEL